MTFSITQFPVVYVSKTGQRTFEIDCEHWSRADKIEFLLDAQAQTTGKKQKPKRRTPEQRLRSLIGLTLTQYDSHGRRVQAPIYTQKELAERLGVSTRTLRRFKNIKGYKLHPRTFERIKKEVVREETRAREYIERRFRMSRGRFLAWRIKVKVPPGVGMSGDLDDLESGEVRVNESDEDEFIMAGPFAFDLRDTRSIAREINFHEDAGRIVVAIYLIERKGES